MTVDDLRRIIENLPGDMPIYLFDSETAYLEDPEVELEPVTAHRPRTIAHNEDGTPSLEALVIS